MATKKVQAIEETPKTIESNEVSLLSINESEENTMADIKIPDNLEKINRSEWIEFLDTKPTSNTPTWALQGVGVTEKTTDYNANVSEEKWIVENNARKEVENYALSSGVEQTAYKNDPVFEFIDYIRYRLGIGKKAKTHALEIDKYSVTDESTTPKYRARLWDAVIEITSNGGDTAKINYTEHYVGDPKFGTVTFSNGTPTFTEEASE